MSPFPPPPPRPGYRASAQAQPRRGPAPPQPPEPRGVQAVHRRAPLVLRALCRRKGDKREVREELSLFSLPSIRIYHKHASLPPPPLRPPQGRAGVPRPALTFRRGAEQPNTLRDRHWDGDGDGTRRERGLRRACPRHRPQAGPRGGRPPPPPLPAALGGAGVNLEGWGGLIRGRLSEPVALRMCPQHVYIDISSADCAAMSILNHFCHTDFT